MEQTNQQSMITVEALINAPVSKVWEYWTEPVHIMKWAAASDEWHTTYSVNEMKEGADFVSRMEAKDGSFGFDFGGVYDEIVTNKLITYTLGDGRKVRIDFSEEDGKTRVVQQFEPEGTNSREMQQGGWQAILNNFKAHAEKPHNEVLLKWETTIKASPEKVYNSMIGEQTYKEWTKVFNETSGVKGSWNKGSKILFTGTDQNGEVGGMVAHIKENMANKFICIEHRGILQGENEITSGPEVESWAGATENYWFHDAGNGNTRLEVQLESNTDFMSYFTETWPKALEVLKQIAER